MKTLKRLGMTGVLVVGGSGCLVIMAVIVAGAVWFWSYFTVDYRNERHSVHLGGELKLNDQQVFTLEELKPSEVTIASVFSGQYPGKPVHDWSIAFRETDPAGKRVEAVLTGSYREGSQRTTRWIAEGESVRTAAGRVYTVTGVAEGTVDFTMHEEFVIPLGSEMHMGNLTRLQVAEIDVESKRVDFLYRIPERVGRIRTFLSM